MLLASEFDKVADALAVVISGNGDPRAVVMLAIQPPVESDRCLAGLPLGINNARDAARFILNLCLQDQWTAIPSWMESIIEHVNTTAQDAELQALAVRVRSRIDPTPDVFTQTWMNDIPFFDRSGFRPLAKKLLTTDDLPVLRVNGPSGAGRSYTARVLQEIADTWSHKVKVVSAEIPSDSPGVYTLEELAEELGFQVKGALVNGMPARTASAYETQLVRWLLAKATAQPEIHIFVIDGAGIDGVQDEIRLFVAALAQRVCLGAMRKQVRLVLLNYPHALQKVHASDTREELLPAAAQLGLTDLKTCISELGQIRTRKGVPLDVPVDDLAAEILAQAPAKANLRLKHVHEQLCALLPN